MATNQTQRPQYFEGQYLGAADLTTAVEYARSQQARHALGAHTWGIAAGLQLTEKASIAGGGQVDIFIQPGIAWDGFGRPVVVLAPYKLTPDKFASFVYDSDIDGNNPEGRLVEVWLRYVESATRSPAPGFEVCPGGQFSRVDEFFQVEVGERKLNRDRRDPLSIAGRTVDARDALQSFDPAAPPLHDDSVPYQSFPSAEQRARWLIPVGLVRWKPEQGGQPGKFVARDAADREASRAKRQYAGLVGESLAAPDGRLRLRDRAKAPSANQSDDLVWAEGNLRVEGDVNIFGGALKLLDDAGKDHGVPLSVNRSESNASGGRSLRVQIGTAAAGQNSFEVGPSVGNTFRPRLTVLDSGRVGIGTTAPNRLLTIQGTGGAFLNVKATVSGQEHEVLLGVDAAGGILSTMTNHDLQLRAGGNDTKVIVKADGRVGIGTNAPNRRLTLFGDAGTYLNVKSDGGDHEVLLGADGNGGIVSTMTNHDLQLRAGGNDTKVIIKAHGHVGIGTNAPAAHLDVNGRILRGGHNFSSAGIVSHLGVVAAEWGTTSDWNILVSPNSMGEQEGISEGDNALLMIRCFALPFTGNSWQVFAQYKYRESDSGEGDWQPGIANWLLVPR